MVSQMPVRSKVSLLAYYSRDVASIGEHLRAQHFFPKLRVIVTVQWCGLDASRSNAFYDCFHLHCLTNFFQVPANLKFRRKYAKVALQWQCIAVPGSPRVHFPSASTYLHQVNVKLSTG